MKNKESLSDKISETGTGHMVCLASDIREYVRKLKERWNHNPQVIGDIDEIFGKEFI